MRHPTSPPDGCPNHGELRLYQQKNRSHSGSQPTKGYGNMGIGILDLGYVGYVNGFVTQYIYIYIYWLVVSTPLKNINVSWGYYSQYMEQ